MISYILMLSAPVQRLGFLVNLMATAGASATRVFEIIDTPNEIDIRPDAISLPVAKGKWNLNMWALPMSAASKYWRMLIFTLNQAKK
ncbi:MAG: hypothetical protein M5U34_27165 [Chloroflexi bacterium]|nr:hypothetical protein [Chloroflexota bacterium]